MDTWVDLDSGTYGAAESIRFIYLSPDEEEIFGELSDNDRIYIAKGMASDSPREFSELLADLS